MKIYVSSFFLGGGGGNKVAIVVMVIMVTSFPLSSNVIFITVFTLISQSIPRVAVFVCFVNF
jgi:hypothetical protein